MEENLRVNSGYSTTGRSAMKLSVNLG